MRPSKRFFLLISLLGLAALISCAPKEIKPSAIPVYQGGIGRYLTSLNSRYNMLKAYMSLNVKKSNGTALYGNALANLDPDETQVRFYQLGIEIGDLQSLMGKKKEQYAVYERAIRDGLVWWDLDQYRVTENSDEITVSSDGRAVVFQPGTLVPLRQRIKLPKGFLIITYADYRQTGDLWYPFSVHVEYGGNTMDMQIKQVEVSFRSVQDQ